VIPYVTLMYVVLDLRFPIKPKQCTACALSRPSLALFRLKLYLRMNCLAQPSAQARERAREEKEQSDGRLKAASSSGASSAVTSASQKRRGRPAVYETEEDRKITDLLFSTFVMVATGETMRVHSAGGLAVVCLM
jgi:hypothetical protein